MRCNMDSLQNHYARWEKPDMEDRLCVISEIAKKGKYTETAG